jgi:hypothetical protein
MDAKQLLFNIVYVPIMKRWGNEEGHQYILGVFNNLEYAKKIADEERKYRGGKYEYVIEAVPFNVERRSGKWPKGIFRVTKSDEMTCLTDDERELTLKDKKL